MDSCYKLILIDGWMDEWMRGREREGRDARFVRSDAENSDQTYHSFSASKADTPLVKALQRKKMFSDCPGRLSIGECLIIHLLAIFFAYSAASRLS